MSVPFAEQTDLKLRLIAGSMSKLICVLFMKTLYIRLYRNAIQKMRPNHKKQHCCAQRFYSLISWAEWRGPAVPDYADEADNEVQRIAQWAK